MNNIPENEEILRPSLSHLPDSYGQWLLSDFLVICRNSLALNVQRALWQYSK